MTPRLASVARMALGLFSALALVAWAYNLHRAGCIADPKGGSWGNPQLALETESVALSFGLLACVGFASMAASRGGLSLVSRAVNLFAVLFLGIVILLFGGFFVETNALAACSASARSQAG